MIITLQDFEKDVEYYMEEAKKGDISIMDNGKILGYLTTKYLEEPVPEDLMKEPQNGPV